MKLQQQPTKWLIKSFLGTRVPFWLVAAWLLLQPSGLARGSEPQKKLLVLYTYGKGGFVPGEVERVFESTLYKQLANPLDLYTEYVDSFRFPAEDYQWALRDFLRRKYGGQKFDLIIAISGPAMRMAHALRDELFPGVPIVFGLGFRETLQHMKQVVHMTGVTVRLDPEGTLELALKAQPDTRKVVVISGNSDDDFYFQSVSRQVLRKYESHIAITYLTGRPLEEVLQRVANLPRQTIILFLSFFEDGVGKKFSTREALSRITQVATAPVYGLVDYGPGSGIVGGSLLNVEIAAREGAELALRVLNGQQPEDIPVAEGQATLPIVDWHQLRRWGIKEARLPSGTIVEGKEPSFWALYHWMIIGAVSLCLIQSTLMVGLLVNRGRRASAERGLRRRLRFETMLSELSAEFANLPAGQARSGITKWTNHLRDSLGLDEGSFFEIPKEATNGPGYSTGAVSPCLADLENGSLKSYLDQLRRGETVSLSDPFELKSEQGEERGLGRVKSLLAIPISVEGSTYVVRFSTSRVARRWPDELVSRLRVVGEIFAATLERQMALETLRESEARNRALVTAMAQMVWRANAPGEGLFASSGWQGLTGQSDQEVRGFGWLNAVHPDDRDRIQQAWAEAVKLMRPYQDELRVQTSGGSYRYLEVRAVPLFGHDGRVREWIGANTDVTERRRAEEDLRKLSERLLTSQDEERRRIARELHDGTVQNLAVVIFNLQRLQKLGSFPGNRFQEVMSNNIILCEQIVKEIRTLSYVLHPPLLDEVGLASALQWYVRGFIERSGIEIELVLLSEVGRLPSEVEIALFRVVQESLTNMRCHSGSSSGRIGLRRERDQVILQVQDGGRGMLRENAGSGDGVELLGVGILGMRQRLQQLGGRLEIESGSNGTTVTAFVPLTRRAYAAYSGSR